VFVTTYSKSITSPAWVNVSDPLRVSTVSINTGRSRAVFSGEENRLHAERVSKMNNDKELRMIFFITISFFELASRGL
jgi:hypothetical protein